MRVLINCEFTGRVRNAFAALGHDAWSCDLLPSETPGNHIQADFRSVIQDSWDFVGYHYECRVMANSGVRWLYEKPGRWEELDQAAEIFNLTLRDTRPGYSENSQMHKHAVERIDRPKDQIIQPWYHGDPFFKKTYLWLRGIDPLEDSNRLIPPKKGTQEYKRWSAVWYESPGKDRWKNRSRTYPGVAKAIAFQWSLLKEKAA